MSAKQDRVAPRTAADIERKYNFGQSFAEAMGLAQDAKKTSKDAKAAAADAADALDNKLDQTEIFNRLTNNGEAQGIYRGEDGQIYINASYMLTGIIDAAVVRVVNLVAEKVQSVLDHSRLDISGAKIALSKIGVGETFNVSNWEDGCAYLYMQQYDEIGNDMGRSQFGANRIQIGGTWVDPTFAVFTNPDGTVYVQIRDDAKKASWKDNGDGTFSLVGT